MKIVTTRGVDKINYKGYRDHAKRVLCLSKKEAYVNKKPYMIEHENSITVGFYKSRWISYCYEQHGCFKGNI